MNLNSNIIKSYDDMLYESRPISFNEFINDKLNKVHKELYLNALSKYYKDIIDKTINSKFVYDFYTAMENNSESLDSFDKVWDTIQRLSDNTQLKKSLKILKINEESFFKEIYKITYKKLDELTNTENSSLSILGDIQDFRIIYLNNYIFLGRENDPNETDYEFVSYKINRNTDEPIEEKVYASELNDYVIILEQHTGTRIGYNMNGEWVLFFNNENKDININFEDIKKKYFEIKNESLKLIDIYKNIALAYYKKSHKIIELKRSEYWMPSAISIISNIRPYSKSIVDLTKYWNMIQSFNNINIYDIKVTNENILDAELCELNYITGMAKIQSRTTGVEYSVPFKYLSGDINVNPDMTLNKGFIPKYNDL